MVGNGLEGGSFATLRALAVADVEHGDLGITGGDRRRHATIHSTAREND
jgi:hypothetical protein